MEEAWKEDTRYNFKIGTSINNIPATIIIHGASNVQIINYASSENNKNDKHNIKSICSKDIVVERADDFDEGGVMISLDKNKDLKTDNEAENEKHKDVNESVDEEGVLISLLDDEQFESGNDEELSSAFTDYLLDETGGVEVCDEFSSLLSLVDKLTENNSETTTTENLFCNNNDLPIDLPLESILSIPDVDVDVDENELINEVIAKENELINEVIAKENELINEVIAEENELINEVIAEENRVQINANDCNIVDINTIENNVQINTVENNNNNYDLLSLDSFDENEDEDDENAIRKKKRRKLRLQYNKEEYHCYMCTYTCTIENVLKKHLQVCAKRETRNNKQVEPQLSCPICGKDRKGEIDLDDHLKKHMDGKLFRCDKCLFNSSQIKKVIQHRRMHTGERPHLCPHCTYRSARRDNLRSHIRRVHNLNDIPSDTFTPRDMLVVVTSTQP